MPLNPTAISEILPFAQDGSVADNDTLSLDIYKDHPSRKDGHQIGIASRAVFNTHARQTAHMASGLAQFIANRYTPGVKDDGDLDKIEEGIAVACKAASTPTINRFTARANAGQKIIDPGFTLSPILNNVALYISGLKQSNNSFTIIDNTISLSEPLTGNEVIELLSMDIGMLPTNNNNNTGNNANTGEVPAVIKTRGSKNNTGYTILDDTDLSNIFMHIEKFKLVTNGSGNFVASLNLFKSGHHVTLTQNLGTVQYCTYCNAMTYCSYCTYCTYCTHCKYCQQVHCTCWDCGDE